MDLNLITYLLFVIPGFCFVWTFRHFTKAQKIGEFEYAVWSFIFGSVIFLLFGCIQIYRKMEMPVVDFSDPSQLLGALLGTGLGLAIVMSFPLGFIFAYFSKIGIFKFVDQKLNKLLDWLQKFSKK